MGETEMRVVVSNGVRLARFAARLRRWRKIAERHEC